MTTFLKISKTQLSNPHILQSFAAFKFKFISCLMKTNNCFLGISSCHKITISHCLSVKIIYVAYCFLVIDQNVFEITKKHLVISVKLSENIG